MMNRPILLVIVLLVLLVILPRSVVVVKQWEQAVIFKFREIEQVIREPGLYFIIPYVSSAQRFDARLLTLNQEPKRFLTLEKKDVIVDFYVKWRIADPAVFYRVTSGDLDRANILLAQRINSSMRDEFGKRTVQEVVLSKRDEVLQEVLNTASRLAGELGVSVVDVRTVRIDLPEDVSESVYRRMRSERERVARDFRARGAETGERIRAGADREREEIIAEAYREAELVRGSGDAESTRIYAKAYTEDEEFYALYRSLNAYRSSFNDRRDVLLLSPDSSFFRYFKDPAPK